MFLFLYLFVLSFLIGQKFNARSKNNLWKDSFVDYMTCYLKQQFYPTGEVCTIEHHTNVVLWGFTIFNVSVQVSRFRREKSNCL
jgi:hypothetical protein